MSKQCYRCLRTKPISSFSHNRSKPDGLNGECMDCRKVINREYYRNIKIAVIELLGGRCVECGNTDVRVLQLDHVNDDGYLDRPKFGAGVVLARAILSGKRSVEGLQILCGNCHHLKSWSQGWP